MKWFYVLVVTMLLGCSGTPDEHGEDAGTVDAGRETSEPRAGDPAVELTKDVPQGPCGRVERTKVVVDGSTYVFTIPLPCNPYYRDIGDPQPKNRGM